MKTEMVSSLFIVGKRWSINGKEFDTYKVGTVANSCSTMHKIHAKEFTLEDFSCEHLFNASDVDIYSMNALKMTIDALNAARKKYLETKVKDYWWQMIQLLPTSYNQKRTVMLSYEVLVNMYNSRNNHKLDEWRVDFINWIKELPYSEIITGEQKDVENFVGTPAAMGLSFNDQRELCGIPPISHEIVTPDTPEMLKKKLNIASPSEAVRGKRWPTACELCNKHGPGDSDEEVCKKCQFYPYSKWAEKE